MRAKLLIELDGTSHEGRAAYDAQRTAYLEERGYTVLRFGNKEIDQNLLGVVKTIIAKAIELTREAAKGPPTSKN
jgi:very-short-patch-repair endonuclease